MKTLYASVVALVAMVVCAPGANATPLPAWDNVIPGPARFRVLNDFNGQAVLDKETGLVWEKWPDSGLRTWFVAHDLCNSKAIGGRLGWRMPTIQELMSLIDPTNPNGNPDVPPNHPFLFVESDYYWSATTDVTNPANALAAGFHNATSSPFPKANVGLVWCVRTGHGGPDAQ